MKITADQYFAGYPDDAGITDEVRANADRLLAAVNSALELAEADGIVLETNAHEGAPHFGTLISGSKDGGWRPQSCPTGAPHSKHKLGLAVDLCDHNSALDPWSGGSAGQDQQLIDLNLAREHPDATPNWCHWQLGAPPSGHWLFRP